MSWIFNSPHIHFRHLYELQYNIEVNIRVVPVFFPTDRNSKFWLDSVRTKKEIQGNIWLGKKCANEGEMYLLNPSAKQQVQVCTQCNSSASISRRWICLVLYSVSILLVCPHSDNDKTDKMRHLKVSSTQNIRHGLYFIRNRASTLTLVSNTNKV